jgi:hypothetical protein
MILLTIIIITVIIIIIIMAVVTIQGLALPKVVNRRPLIADARF